MGPQLNWWSAYNWCLANGRHLTDVKEMNCYQATDNALAKAGMMPIFCCKQGQACQQSSWDTTLWDGENILEGKEQEVAKFGDKIVALRKIYGAKKIWTASAQGNTSENSCHAFDIDLPNGRAGSNTLRQNAYLVLCE